MTRFIVILGASNLTFSLRQVLHRAARSYDGPIDIYLAYGPGRSFGLRAGNPLNQFVGIARTKLWQDLRTAVARDQKPELRAFITDLGNDLVYTRGEVHLVRWLERILKNLTQINARIGVTALPVASLQKMPRPMFQLVRRFFFPSIRISRAEAMLWIQSMQSNLEKLSQKYHCQLLTTEPGWYTLDHFHIKFLKRAKVFNAWLDALWGPPQHEAPTLISQRRLHSYPFHHYWRWGQERRYPQEGLFITHNARVFFY